MITCKSCGFQNPAGSIFCTKCARKLSGNIASHSYNGEPSEIEVEITRAVLAFKTEPMKIFCNGEFIDKLAAGECRNFKIKTYGGIAKLKFDLAGLRSLVAELELYNGATLEISTASNNHDLDVSSRNVRVISLKNTGLSLLAKALIIFFVISLCWVTIRNFL